MREYKNKNPEFKDSINLIEPTDTNHADNVIAADICNFENTLANKKDIENLSTKVDTEIDILFKQLNFIYRGINLVEKFKKEIAKFSDEWAWIKDRIEKNNFSGIHIGDYIPLKLKDEEYLEMQIAGIDTYADIEKNPRVKHHIDFISRDCLKNTVKWNLSQTNNGRQGSENPFVASSIYQFLNKSVHELLPEQLQSKISSKSMFAELRYSTGYAPGQMPHSYSFDFISVGQLWLPTEYEIYGKCTYGTPKFSEGHTIQYPLFANNLLHRIKKSGSQGSACSWWSSTAANGTFTAACLNSQFGVPDSTDVRGDFFAPLCFRIAAQ